MDLKQGELGKPRVIIGTHPKTIALHKTLGLLSQSRVPVLIEGEIGTGKRLVARILHNLSTPEEPFVEINCSIMIPVVLDKYFFGTEVGSWAHQVDSLKKGELGYAAHGTVLLDEICEIPLAIQGKLIRTMQENKFLPVGGIKAVPFNARIIATTRKDLKERVDSGRFREDLYYCLATCTLSLPPLRERKVDIPPLAQYLLDKIRKQKTYKVLSISQNAMQKIIQYDWPGNILELENVILQATILTRGKILRAKDINNAITKIREEKHYGYYRASIGPGHS